MVRNNQLTPVILWWIIDFVTATIFFSVVAITTTIYDYLIATFMYLLFFIYPAFLTALYLKPSH